MKKLLLYLSFMLICGFGVAQTIVNSPSINVYANVVVLDYCENSIEVPAGMGGQFSIGDKILILQMKGAELIQNNVQNSGLVEDYRSAGNYEINEIKSINSGSNDILVLKYEIDNVYNISGLVQIVNIPQYEDVVFQNTLTCQPWNGSFGGVLTFNASGTVTLNADIDISFKGFRGGEAEDLGGVSCFSGIGYNGYNCEYSLECGAPKGEGIGDRYITKELARSPNANGGGGGNDHNAGGGGGGAYGYGGVGGNTSNSGCNGNGAYGGELLNYFSNKIFMSGGGGAGDGGNLSGVAIGSTSGGNSGAIMMIKASTLISNGNSLNSNGSSVTAIASYDGAGGGGAGGLIILEIETYSDILNVEANGGSGGSVDDVTRCPGPGGGGSGGVVWLSQTSTPSNITADALGGVSGIVNTAPCMGSTNDATNGGDGGFVFNFVPNKSDVIFERLKLEAGGDTVICGEGVAPLWSEASASHSFDFAWIWSSGIETENNFDFNPEFSGNYNVIATASYNVFYQTCEETYLVNVDIRKPNINIIASSFSGDTITIGEPYFVNAIVTPLNPNYLYEWNPADKVDPNNERNAIAIPFESEEVCLTVTDEQGCSNTECVDLYVHAPSIKAANAFSPNNDNLNDYFIPTLSEDLEVVSFRVYDRWGDLVHKVEDATAWDGKKKGKELPLELYIWHIKVKQILSEKIFERQGDISIVR